MTLHDLLHDDVQADAVRDHIGLQHNGPVAVVTLARPQQYNALTLASWREMRSVFQGLGERTNLRAVVIRGSGSHAFGAGADINEFPEVRLTPEDALGYNEAIAAALEAVAALPLPVIAMIRGLAVGGGCELAAACDVRLASADSRFGIPIGRLGVTLGYTEANALARLIGPTELKYMLFSGRLLGSDEALRIGLVQQVVTADDLIDETVRLVDAIVSSAPVTMRAAKLVADMCGRPLNASDTEALTRLTIEAYGGSDLKEGVAAFQEGRTPKFHTTEGNRHGRP